MAGNELGPITHCYWYGAGYYFREPVNGGEIQYWTGTGWQLVSLGHWTLKYCAITHKAA